jgi:eukaryotic-like serine/threonine-protein kinase
VGFFDGLLSLFSSGPTKIDVAKRFDIRGRSGQGSMSKVFQAYDNKLGRVVCLKLLDKEKTQKFEARFKSAGLKKPTEGEICMSLKHPNLVQTYEHGLTIKDEPYLIMEWIEGVGMNFLVESRSPQLNGKRIEYMRQLCDAVAYLHGQKYLHRDLCPRNVMITNEGVVKLIDLVPAIAPEPRITWRRRSSSVRRPITASTYSPWA